MSQTYEDRLTLEAWNGKLGRIPLMTCTVEEDTTEFDIDITGIDWASYAAVAMVIIPSAYVNADMYLKTNNTNKPDYRALYGTGTTTNGMAYLSIRTPSLLIFPTRYNADIVPTVLVVTETDFGYGMQGGAKYSNLTTLKLTTGYHIPAGTTIRFTGIR